MSTINDGGPAFPSTEPAQDLGIGGTLPAYHHPGMSLRAYFAAHAPITYSDAREQLGKDVSSVDVIRWLAASKAIYAARMMEAMEQKA